MAGDWLAWDESQGTTQHYRRLHPDTGYRSQREHMMASQVVEHWSQWPLRWMWQECPTHDMLERRSKTVDLPPTQ